MFFVDVCMFVCMCVCVCVCLFLSFVCFVYMLYVQCPAESFAACGRSFPPCTCLYRKTDRLPSFKLDCNMFIHFELCLCVLLKIMG